MRRSSSFAVVQIESDVASTPPPLRTCSKSGGLNRSNAYTIQAAFRLIIDMRRKRALFCGSNIFPQMLRIECTYNGGMHIRMRQRKAQKEGSAALAWLAQFIQTRFLKLLPAIYVP